MNTALPYLLLAPATLFLAVFFLWPFSLVAIESLTRDGAWSAREFPPHGDALEVPAGAEATRCC